MLSFNHKPEMCPFKDKECFYCKVKAHTITVFRKKLKTSKGETHQTHQLSHTTQDGNKTNKSNDGNGNTSQFKASINYGNRYWSFHQFN